MSAEYTYYVNAVIADIEELETSSSLTVTITNTGDVAGTDLGFCLQVASNDGPFEYPSTNSPAINLVDIIAFGEAGYGVAITQASATTTFAENIGDSYETRIPLSIGSGSSANELAPGSSVDVILSLTLPGGIPSQNFYVDLVIL
jgi:hypothetical protein